MAEQDLLWRAARRASRRPFFLASALLAYGDAEGLDETALAERLRCHPADLPALLVCRRPRGDNPDFTAQVQRIADRFRLDAARLAEVLRLVEGLEALGGPTRATAVDLLAAARDRDEAEDEEGAT